MNVNGQRSRYGAAGGLTVLLSLALITLGCSGIPASGVSDPTTRVSGSSLAATTTPAAAVRLTGSARTALNRLPVKGRAAKTGYARERFGQTWADVDRNGCDTRNDILRRDLRSVTLKPGTRGCVVAAGTLADPYTGRTIRFVRGPESARVQIDHVVALSNSWQTGSVGWEPGKRTAFANDPLNLLAVDGPSNERKRDGDAATWLPPSRAFRCAYVARQIGVKTKYHLWVTPAEQAAMSRVLATCPRQPLFTGGGPTTTTVGVPKPTPAPTTPQPGSDPRFATCTAARAAGYGPYVRGVDPEYAWYRDADGDGTVCE